MPQFPKGWPENCPPLTSAPANGVHFRAAKTNPPGPDEFKTHAERGAAPKADPCLRSGLSVLRSMEDAVHQTQLFPKLGKLLFQGELTPDCGQTQLTQGRQPTHTTWWPCEGVDRASLFSFVREVP